MMADADFAAAKKMLDFVHLLECLKNTRRTGWLLRGIEDCESIADHMYRMAVMLLVMPEREMADIDRHRCIMMALVHDLAEAVVGDMTPECGVSVEAKHRVEEEAMVEICKLLPDCRSAFVHDLFTEYMLGDTKEAKMVKQLDKLEFLVQSAEYERKRAVDLEDFFKSTRHLVKRPYLVDLMVAVEEERLHVKRDQLESKPWK